MWITRNKFDKNGEDSLVLWFDDEIPTRMENGDYKYWFGFSGIELKYANMNLYKKYKYLTWEDDPIEVTLSIKHTPEEVYALAEKAYKDGGYDVPEQTMFGTVNVDFTNFRWGFEKGYYHE